MENNTSKLNKNIRKRLAWSVALTVALIVGIPLTVVGAINLKSFGLPLMIIGIVFVVCGFYGSPVLWASYSEKLRYKRTVEAVTIENFRSVNAIAAHLNQSPKNVLIDIKTAINGLELVGFTLNGDEIRRVANISEDERSHSVECPNCGGINYFNDMQRSVKCDYCGRVVDL